MVDEADKARPRSESMRDPCPRHGPGHGPSPVPSRWRRDPSLYPSHGSWSEVDEQMKLIRVSVATKCEAKPYESSELDSRTAVLETGEVMSLVYRVIIRVIIRVIVGFVMRVKRVIYPCTLGLSPWISPSPGSESRPVRLPALRCVAPSCLDRPDVETQAREYARRPLSGLRGQPGAGLVRVDFRVIRMDCFAGAQTMGVTVTCCNRTPYSASKSASMSHSRDGPAMLTVSRLRLDVPDPHPGPRAGLDGVSLSARGCGPAVSLSGLCGVAVWGRAGQGMRR